MKFSTLLHRLRCSRAIILMVSMAVGFAGFAAALTLISHHRTSGPERARSSGLARPPAVDDADAFAPSESEDDPDGRAAWFNYQRAYPFGAILADGRRRACGP